ncbi:preprotein translocase subunit YajC [Nocardioides sp. MH1]|uniref:preprotein translocase subunit YajC n=1 Tax=Nocardioides sp. MH1 TaxID=3242490 RepID=UPI0035228F28
MELGPLLTIAAIAVIFWLLIIRPAQRRQREISQVQSSIEVGDTVVLTSGIFGTVTGTDDATLMVEIATGVSIKVARGAVGSVIRDDEDETADEVDTTEQTGVEAPLSTDDNEER